MQNRPLASFEGGKVSTNSGAIQFGLAIDAPFLNKHLRLAEDVEDFAIQTFIPKRR